MNTNTLNATVSTNSPLLIFKNDDQQFDPPDKTITLKFEDPRNRGEIVRILFDPTYIPDPTDPVNADFWISTAFRSPSTGELRTQSALCTWNSDKSVAECQIEDDGGRYQLIVRQRGSNQTDTRIDLRVAEIEGYHGFELGRYDDPQQGVSDVISINVENDNEVLMDIKFDNPTSSAVNSTIRWRNFAAARPFEKLALENLKRIIYEKMGNDYERFETFFKDLYLSSHSLYGGKEQDDLSIFFRSVDAGGSGATYYYILAFKSRRIAPYTYGLYFETDEAGSVYISDLPTETGYAIIGVEDRGDIQEYTFWPEINGYDFTAAE